MQRIGASRFALGEIEQPGRLAPIADLYVMQANDPNTPVFELYVGDEKVGLLYEPKREEMFWCSYRIEPTSEAADRILRDETIWNEVNFTVRAKDGRIPNAHTFTGGDYVAFCKRESNRLSFRSLWPT